MSATIQNETKQSSVVKIVAAFFAIYFIWGTTFLGIRIAIETIPPFIMAGIRFFLAGGLMLVIMLVRGAKFPTRLHWRSALIIGGLMLVAGNGLLTFAEQWVPSGLAALVVSSMPIWVALLEWLAYKGRRPNTQTMLGLLVGFAGLAVLFAPGSGNALGGRVMLGSGIVLAATVFWAIGGLYSRRAPLPEDTLVSTATEMLAGGLLLLILAIVVGEPARLDIGAISVRSALALLYLSVFGSIVAYTAYIWLMQTVDPAKVNTNFYVNPVIAVFMGWTVADETLTVQMVIAMSVILLGVAIVNTKLSAIRQALRRTSARYEPVGDQTK